MEMTATSYRPTVLPSALYAIGMVAIFFGERVLGVGKLAVGVTVAGLLTTVAAVAVRGARMRQGPPGHRAAERRLLTLYAVGFGALVLYFFNSNVYFSLTGHTFDARFPRLSGVFGALWPALWLCATLPLIFVELALFGMARAPVLDQGRLRAAARSGLGIGLALVFCFTAAYVASERDVKKDLSHFRTARSGEATRKVVEALDKGVDVYLFFPPANEVREEVESYFNDLARVSRHLKVHHLDHALHPAKAKDLGVSGNGIVVIAREALKEQIAMPLTLQQARSQLRVLDQEVHKRLLGVTRKPRVAYFTVGHDERTFAPASDTDLRGTIKSLRSMLVDQGYEPKELGLAQGLGVEIPADATIVLVVGPRKPFLPEEMTALGKYLDRKGRLLIALDPEHGQPVTELLAGLALKYTPVTLANDKMYLPRTYQYADRQNIASGSFSSHVSVSTVGRLGMRAPVVFVGAGYLEKDEKASVGLVSVDFTIHADGATWPDKDGNFQNDEATELRQGYELAAAVSRRNASALLPEDEARAVVLADSDCLSDQYLGFGGNPYLALDALRWLGGEEKFTGQINTEEDVPIAHTRNQDQLWFYSTIFGAPALVLGAGLFVTRTRRRARAASKDKTRTQGASGGGPAGGAPGEAAR